MRALTLSAEARKRGWSTTFAGDLDDTARRLLEDQGVGEAHSIKVGKQAQALPRLVDDLHPDVIHVDSYLPESGVFEPGDRVLSNMQDGTFGVRPADLTIDPTLDAESWTVGGGAAHLAGVAYAPIRDQVRAVRGRWSLAGGRPRVLLVLGGTDPFGFTPRLLEAMLDGDQDLELTVVAPAAVQDETRRIAAPVRDRVTVKGFLPELPAAAVEHDLVISAAGTSVWDLACMGVPAAIACVTDNQLRGYDAAVDRGIAVGIGHFPGAEWNDAANEVLDVLADESRLRELSRTGMAAVDGLGAWRIVGAWESLLRTPPVPSGPGGLTCRRARIDDARILFDWRNDPDTRRMSRTTDPVHWDGHLSWLGSVIADDTRVLLVVEQNGQAVGTVRWDHRGGIDWEASIAVAPSRRGQGLASRVLAAGEGGIRASSPRRLIASVNDINIASRRLFARAGYLPYSPANSMGFAEYAKMLAAVPTG